MIKQIWAGLLAAATLLSADTITLRNGARYDGTFLGGDTRSIRFAVGNQVNTYYLTDVESIQFNNAPASSAANGNLTPGSYSTPQPPPAPAAPAPYAAPNTPAAPTAPATAYNIPTSASGVEIPAGTQIVVRLIDPVDSDQDHLGQTYRASLDQPVVVNGQVVIPRGADAVAKLIDAKQSGKIEGRTTLTLDLKSITVNGRSYDVVTTGVVEASSSRGSRSAKVIGGATALGALIGGIAGGGKGAAIGAGSGAAVGTTAQIATSGQHVRIPSETRLTFTLQNPLDL